MYGAIESGGQEGGLNRALRLLWLSHGPALLLALGIWQASVAFGATEANTGSRVTPLAIPPASDPMAATRVLHAPPSVKPTAYIVCTAVEARDLRFNAPNAGQALFAVWSIGPQSWIDQIMARAVRGEVDLVAFDC